MSLSEQLRAWALVDNGGVSLPAVSMIEAADALDSLEHWKDEAIEVLTGWERVWEACGRPGPLGASKADNVGAYIIRLAGELEDARNAFKMNVEENAEVFGELRAEHEELKQWVSDACELLRDVRADCTEDDAIIEGIDLLLRRAVKNL